jgi:hypothetical protein
VPNRALHVTVQPRGRPCAGTTSWAAFGSLPGMGFDMPH